MIEDRKLIPAPELRRLRIGSFEEKIGEAKAVAQALLGPVPFEIIATRENDAVVYTDGRFLRLELREEGPRFSPLDVDVVDPSSIHAFVEDEAQLIAKLFLEGSLQMALEHLQNLVPSVPSKRDALAQVEFAVSAPRHWRRVFAARSKQFGRFCGDDLSSLEEGRLRPKFDRLYDEPINEDKLGDYADRVTEDLETVTQRLEQMQEATAAALTSLGESLLDPAEGDEVLESFGHFAEDLADDLRLLGGTYSHALEAVDGVSARGRLHDIIVEGLHEREVASRFVVVVATRLADGG